MLTVDPEPRPRAQRGLFAAACVTYLAILGSSVLTFASPLAGYPIRTLGLLTIGLIILECAILSTFCITVDRQYPKAGWISLSTAAFVWILGFHYWITLYALLPESRSPVLLTFLLVIGHACAILVWVASVVLGTRSIGGTAGRSAPGLIAVVIAGFGVLAAVMGLSAAL